MKRKKTAVTSEAGSGQSYPLKTVAATTGLTPDLVRAWERRYGVTQPLRGPRGARLYSTADIEQLDLLARAVRRGFAIGDIARFEPDRLRQLLADHDARARSLPPVTNDAVEAILETLVALDASAAKRRLSEALMASGGARFVHDVAAPLLSEVGDRWADGRLTIAGEHLCTSLLRELISGLIASQPRIDRPSLLLTAPSGECHELGLLLVNLLASYRQIGTVLIGIDLPVDEIIRAVRSIQPRIVGISAVNADNRGAMRQALSKLVREIPVSVPVWLGGRDAAAVFAEGVPPRVHLLDQLEATETELARLSSILTQTQSWKGQL